MHKIITRRAKATKRNGPTEYRIEVMQAPRWKVWRGQLYHFYDMRIPARIPGWRKVEKLLRRFGAEHRHLDIDDLAPPRWRDRLYGWSVEQDLRCYRYNEHDHLGWVTIDQETYDKLGNAQKISQKKKGGSA